MRVSRIERGQGNAARRGRLRLTPRAQRAREGQTQPENQGRADAVNFPLSRSELVAGFSLFHDISFSVNTCLLRPGMRGVAILADARCKRKEVRLSVPEAVATGFCPRKSVVTASGTDKRKPDGTFALLTSARARITGFYEY